MTCITAKADNNIDSLKSAIAGAVTLYNPEAYVLDNIKTYIDQVSFLWIIDNSDKDNSGLLSELNRKNFEYLPQYGNKGIAAALNIAAGKALENKYSYLFTMDQDSSVQEDLVFKALCEFEQDANAAIIAPFIIHSQNPQTPPVKRTEEIMVAITSGSMLKLDAYNAAGSFLDKLFIDYVDHEFCLRLRKLGFKIIQLNTAYIYHNLGDIKKRKFLGVNMYPTNHSPLRLYYRTRNRAFVYQKYKRVFPGYVKKDKIAFLKEIFKILLYEEHKLEKCRMIVKGFRDYKRDKFGKY